MPKKKRTKSKKTKKIPDHSLQVIQNEDIISEYFHSIQADEDSGIELVLKPNQVINPIFTDIAPLLTKEEFNIISTCSAFGDVELKEAKLSKSTEMYSNGKCRKLNGTPALLVPVYGGNVPPSESTKVPLGQELKHLSTVLHPAEMKWFLAELTSDLVEDAPVTHTDISDAVIASIVPSTAQKLALQADAQYKYTTAQFLQVYVKLRHVVLEHKIMLAGSQSDALFLAASELPIDRLEEQDLKTPISAVEVLQLWDDMVPVQLSDEE